MNLYALSSATKITEERYGQGDRAGVCIVLGVVPTRRSDIPDAADSDGHTDKTFWCRDVLTTHSTAADGHSCHGHRGRLRSTVLAMFRTEVASALRSN